VAVRGRPELTALPIVLLSAALERIAPGALERAAPAATLPKPFAPEALLDAVARATPPVEALRARLEHVPLPELLQLLAHQRQTGVLAVDAGDGRVVELALRDGRIDLALGRGLDREIGPAPPSGAEVEPASRRSAHERRSGDLLVEALRFVRGEIVFERFARRDGADDARLGLDPGVAVMDALRRLDERRLLEEQLPSVDALFVLGVAPPPADLDAGARRVLSAIEEPGTVRDLAERSGLGVFDVLAALTRLLVAGCVRPATGAFDRR
jgi:hypothetical protein